MATEEIEISDLELIKELSPDNVLPIETTTKTFATTLKKIRDWLGIESAILKQVPTGLILPYGGSTAPEGFLLCNGATIKRTTYANLFKAIGTTYGAGDGSTTFKIPSASNIVTSVNTSVPIKGNGMTVGMTNSTGEGYGLHNGNGLNDVQLRKGSYGKQLTETPSNEYYTPNKNIGLTTDSSKSGIVGTVTRGSFTCKFIIKY